MGVMMGSEKKRVKMRRWPCSLMGHKIELVWTHDGTKEYEAMCVRCGERHLHVLGMKGDWTDGETESGKSQQPAQQ
jgi:hypothetical protein